ncbi:hypothetical protein [Nonlabens xiamenensis]|uniref:hypothetical protein n=1 Tax=Nonlabens xiamenensis TaxID=2341043 RepID=UPI000F61112E|nr:hypothetical protein [Nonlabens xiamenensis]
MLLLLPYSRWWNTWTQILTFAVLIYLLLELSFLIFNEDVVLVIVIIFTLIYEIYRSSRKNVFYRKRPNEFSLTINRKKVGTVSDYIDEVNVEDRQLLIRRINHIDTFNISNIRPKGLNKLIDRIISISPQLARTSHA